MSEFLPPLRPLVLVADIKPPAAMASWDIAKLALIRGIEDGVLFHHGVEVFGWGDPSHPREWASCGRAGASMTCWFREATVNPSMRAALDQPVVSLGTATALTFPPHLLLWQALGYIGANGQWHYSNWWKPMAAVFAEVVGRKLHDYFNQEIAPRLPGNLTAKENAADGTPRILGSVRDAVQWALLMLANGGDVLAPDLVQRVLTPGVYEYEALQVHLIRHEKAWELDLPGVQDGFCARDGDESDDHGHGLIAGFPDSQIAVAYRGGTPQRVLPALFEAVIS